MLFSIYLFHFFFKMPFCLLSTLARFLEWTKIESLFMNFRNHVQQDCTTIKNLIKKYLNRCHIENAFHSFDMSVEVRKYPSMAMVRNIWVFSPLVPSKREKNILLLISQFCLVCIFFQGRVLTFQFLNDEIHNQRLITKICDWAKYDNRL